jgi:oligopeptide/dipeptide ABC transporter ATP-binding protein
MTDLVEVEGLEKSFSVERDLLGRTRRWEHAVRGVSFTIRQGETLALVGESGAGKSTVGQLVLRLIEADAGTINFGAVNIRELSRRGLQGWRRDAQVVFQDPYNSLDPRMTVGASVAEPLTVLERLGPVARNRRALELIEQVGLTAHHFDRYPYEFSGGQLQRLAIARAIATNPSLVVCDEPVAALDVSIRAQIINLLRDLQKQHGMSYLFISHDLSLVRAIADRVAVMYKGKIVEEGATRSIFRDPRHPYTKMLLSAIPMPDPRRRQLDQIDTDPQPAAVVLEHEGACDFRHRCPSSHERCGVETPLVVRLPDTDVAVACHLFSGSGAR